MIKDSQGDDMPMQDSRFGERLRRRARLPKKFPVAISAAPIELDDRIGAVEMFREIKSL